MKNNGGECGIVSEERLGGGGRKIVGCCVECVDFKGKVAVVFIQKGDEFCGLAALVLGMAFSKHSATSLT